MKTICIGCISRDLEKGCCTSFDLPLEEAISKCIINDHYRSYGK